MKKKILVFSSIGGGGHMSTVQALQSCLGDRYEIKSVETFQDVLKSFFVLDHYRDGKYGVLKIYNYFLQNNRPFVCNLYLRLGKIFIKSRRKTIKKIFYDYLVQEKPDLVISVVPVVNFYILQVAQALNVPFLIIPSDIDVRPYLFDFSAFSYEKMYMTMHLDIELMHNQLVDVGIDSRKITVVGSPVRESFLQKKDKESLKQKWGVGTDDPVIVLMMGAQGSQSVVLYCKQLARLKAHVHVFVCIGKNEALKKAVGAIQFPAHVQVHIIGFTQEIDELMAIADLFITKTGGISVCEGLYMSVPMLLDATSVALDWERYNYDFVSHHGFGELLTDIKSVSKRIDYLLSHPEIIRGMRHSMMKFKKKNSQQEIPLLISDILE